MRTWIPCFLIGLTALCAETARAEFVITSAVLEFSKEGPRQQDIELVSRSRENDYIVTEIYEIAHAGKADETRVRVEDPTRAGLLVTPDKAILSAGSRKVLRFVLLEEPGERERIYRVTIKPVIRSVDNSSQVGLKVLVGYEVLVIVRPFPFMAAYDASRKGKVFTVNNSGNTNILFQNGQQCQEMEKCPLPSVLRVYPGETGQVELPYDKPVSYSVWDGKTSIQRNFD